MTVADIVQSALSSTVQDELDTADAMLIALLQRPGIPMHFRTTVVHVRSLLEDQDKNGAKIILLDLLKIARAGL